MLQSYKGVQYQKELNGLSPVIMDLKELIQTGAPITKL